MKIRLLTALAVSTATLALAAAGCGGGGGTGRTITADGSSTVGPFTTKAAEDFRAAGGVDVTVGISGTGGGFERVSGEKGGLGYFGFSYFEENQDKLKAVEVNGGQGCVAPSVASAQDGSYAPLSRPLFVYVKKSSFDGNQSIRDFVKYMLDNEQSIAEAARFVPLSDEQLAEQQTKFEDATA